MLRELKYEATDDSLDRHGVYGAVHSRGLEDPNGRRELEPEEKKQLQAQKAG